MYRSNSRDAPFPPQNNDSAAAGKFAELDTDFRGDIVASTFAGGYDAGVDGYFAEVNLTEGMESAEGHFRASPPRIQKPASTVDIEDVSSATESSGGLQMPMPTEHLRIAERKRSTVLIRGAHLHLFASLSLFSIFQIPPLTFSLLSLVG